MPAPIELAELQRRKALGHLYVQLVVTKKRSRTARSQKIRVMPGVWGICIGQLWTDDQWLVDVSIDELIEAMEKS